VTNNKSNIWNLPNCLTMSRVAAVPVLVLLLLSDTLLTSWAAFLVYLTAVLTDLLDGFLARRQHQVTDLGKFLDPVADKLLNTAAMIMLIPLGRVPAWMVFLFVARDIAINGLRAVASADGVIIDASVLGKRKTFIQGWAVSLLLIHYPVWFLDIHLYGMILLWITLFITYWSAIGYFHKFYKTVIAPKK